MWDIHTNKEHVYIYVGQFKEMCTVTFVQYCPVTSTADLDTQQSNTSH